MRRALLSLALAPLLISPAAAQSHAKPSAARPIPAPTVLMLSDIHLDPFHDPAKAPQLAAAPVSQWDAILNAPPSPTQAADFAAIQTACKARGVDTPNDLFQSALTAMQSRAHDAAFITLSGDLIAHNFDCRFAHLLPGRTPQDYLDFVDKTIRYVAMRLHAAFPTTPLYIALGNNDSGCADFRIDENSPFLAYNAAVTADVLPAGDRDAVLASYFAHGDYSLPLPAPMHNARIVVLDDLFQSYRYANCSGAPAPQAVSNQLAWLQQELATARARHEKVWVMAHIPPGISPNSSFKKNVCGGDAPVSYLSSDAFANLLSQYADIITLGIFGHSHMDELRFLPAANPDAVGIPIKVGPSITPVDGNNPAFTIATVSPATATLTDYTTYAASGQSGASAVWSPEYTYSDSYQQPDFSARSLQKLTVEFTADSAGATPLSHAYMHHYAAGADIRALNHNWHEYSCSIANMTAAAFTACTCAATK